MKTDDIFGATSIIRHKPREDQADSLKVDDINDKYRNKSKRTTNPLEPVYTYKADPEYDDPIEIGYIYGSRPKERTHKLSNNNNLNTKDILGAQADSTRVYNLNKNTNARPMNRTHDIQGAQSNTLKKSFQGDRKTDPLDPK
jgi:hypothetical protein